MAIPVCPPGEDCGNVRTNQAYKNQFEKKSGLKSKISLAVLIGNAVQPAPPGWTIPPCFLPGYVPGPTPAPTPAPSAFLAYTNNLRFATGSAGAPIYAGGVPTYAQLQAHVISSPAGATLASYNDTSQDCFIVDVAGGYQFNGTGIINPSVPFAPTAGPCRVQVFMKVEKQGNLVFMTTVANFLLPTGSTSLPPESFPFSATIADAVAGDQIKVYAYVSLTSPVNGPASDYASVTSAVFASPSNTVPGPIVLDVNFARVR